MATRLQNLLGILPLQNLSRRNNPTQLIPDGFLAVGSNIDISSIGQIKSLGKIEPDKFIAADGDDDASINVSTGGNIISGSGLYAMLLLCYIYIILHYYP